MTGANCAAKFLFVEEIWTGTSNRDTAMRWVRTEDTVTNRIRQIRLIAHLRSVRRIVAVTAAVATAATRTTINSTSSTSVDIQLFLNIRLYSIKSQCTYEHEICLLNIFRGTIV